MGKLWLFLAALVIPVTVTPQDTFKAYDADGEKYAWDIEVIASGLEVPWDLAPTLDKTATFLSIILIAEAGRF